jgi:hypothetical protein
MYWCCLPVAFTWFYLPVSCALWLLMLFCSSALCRLAVELVVCVHGAVGLSAVLPDTCCLPA